MVAILRGLPPVVVSDSLDVVIFKMEFDFSRTLDNAPLPLPALRAEQTGVRVKWVEDVVDRRHQQSPRPVDDGELLPHLNARHPLVEIPCPVVRSRYDLPSRDVDVTIAPLSAYGGHPLGEASASLKPRTDDHLRVFVNVSPFSVLVERQQHGQIPTGASKSTSIRNPPEHKPIIF